MTVMIAFKIAVAYMPTSTANRHLTMTGLVIRGAWLLQHSTTLLKSISCKWLTELLQYRVRHQSGFPTFTMAQRHYVRTSATRYQCCDNCTKVKTFVMSAWYHWWHVGPYFGLYLTCGLARGQQTLLTTNVQTKPNTTKSIYHPSSLCRNGMACSFYATVNWSVGVFGSTCGQACPGSHVLAA